MKVLNNFYKKIFIIIVFTSYFNLICFSENNESKIKFIKGNLQEKTEAIRESSNEESFALSKLAINFVLENKKIIGEDRDLDALAVAAVLSLQNDDISALDFIEREKLANQICDIFLTFESDTVRVSVLNKIENICDVLSPNNFIVLLNDFILNCDKKQDRNIIKPALQTVSKIGDGSSFDIIYNIYKLQTWNEHQKDFEDALILLADKSFAQIVRIIQDGNTKTEVRPLFDLITKSENISVNFKSEIAENVLSDTIYIANNSSSVTREIVSLQIDSFDIIVKNKWTRVSAIVPSFFELSGREFNAGIMTENEFTKIINGISIVSPVYASATLSSYLAELNKQTEEGANVSENVVLAVISALGGIGDKSSFDSLLYVTYVNYSNMVIVAARDALARLKW